EEAWGDFLPDDDAVSSPLEGPWTHYPDLAPLLTARVGKRLEGFFPGRAKCLLEAGGFHWSPSRFEESIGRVTVGKIIVAPPWIFPDIDGKTIIIKIRPSMGFGTGHNPSTRLAFLLLDR